MVKTLERYKKFVSITAILLMGSAMLLNIAAYGFFISNLQKDKYFIARIRYEVQKEVDFENILVNEIKYFLYKNETEGAVDAGDDLNNFIVDELTDLCEHDTIYLESDPDRARGIRDNINSVFMLTSEAYILLLMTILLITVTILIPQKMREHHIPMLMR